MDQQLVDLHSHILPGLDDGADTMQEALAMAAAACEDGITTLAATPHYGNGKHETNKEWILTSLQAFRERLSAEGIPLEVVPGSEVRINKRILDDLDHDRLITLNNGRYLLLELPSDEVPGYTFDILHELELVNVVPIIAHPERNRELAHDLSLLGRMIEAGALSQVTAHSITGWFGRRVQNTTIEMCKRNLVHLVASDAHDSKGRTFELREAYRGIEQAVGKASIEIFRTNAAKVVRNEPIESQNHLLVTSKAHGKFGIKRFLGLN